MTKRSHTTWAEELEREADGQFALTVTNFVLRARAHNGKSAPAAIVIDASSRYQVRWSRHLAVPDPVLVENPDQIGPEFDENGVPMEPSSLRCFDTFDEFEDWALKFQSLGFVHDLWQTSSSAWPDCRVPSAR